MFKRIRSRYPDMFVYLPAEHVHLHDKILAKTFLRILPSSLTPNKITLFRLLSTPLVIYLIAGAQYKIGVLVFLLVAFTDALDGALARTQNKITRFGMLFDPLADKLLIGSVVLLLVFEYFAAWIGYSILGIEAIFVILAIVAKSKFHTVKMANMWGKVKMILQVLAVFVTLMALLLDFPLLLSVAAWLFGFAIAFAILSLFFHGV